MKKAIFYHAGCPVCVKAKQQLLSFIDQFQVNTEVVHPGQQIEIDRISDAGKSGVKSVPALVVGGQTFHFNYGTSLEEVKNG